MSELEIITNTINEMPKSIYDLDVEQLRQILLSTKIDEYKLQMGNHLKKEAFDLDSKIVMWLENKSENTSRMYRLYLNDFINYLDSTHVLDVKAFDADKYINYIMLEASAGKAKLILASLSSFYSILYRWGDVIMNPFMGCKIKTKMVVVDKTIMTEKEIEIIEEKYISNKISDRKMRLAIHIMKTYGVRVGFFNEDLKYTGKALSGISKGKAYSVVVGNDVLIENNKNILKELGAEAIQSAFKRNINKLYLDGKINKKYSVHDFRHFTACREYEKDKDIYRVSALLNHSSVVITEKYLAGLRRM